MHFGLPSPSCRHLVGKQIISRNKKCNKTVDAYGYNIKTAIGCTGDHVRYFHDQFVQLAVNSLVETNIPYRGGRGKTCKNIFHDVINTNLNGESNDRLIQGIIPDIILDAEQELPQGSIFDNIRTLFDVKTVSPGKRYHVADTSTVADKRASEVSPAYYRVARALDIKHNGTQPGTCGPVEARLREFGQLGKVIGIAIGAYGECSSDVYALRDFIACKMSSMRADGTIHNNRDFVGMSRKTITRKWGLSIHRGWARVLIDRIPTAVNGVCGHDNDPDVNVDDEL